ncbi:hypothetical protein ACFSE0_12555 [Ochrobactrum teleogrylli]|uniref:Uncharacterized protein n=1 Tax=Ochrobactrum teleogrylli TaxID=2479765 RepID=A0ABY2Y4H2_9HYPH|nr:hypothetical protein [[Ochrobactrum] teleogrylli]TNV15853.1 hypothetical protein FIC94_11235 [[Ochrobactrum] teleogrylli]
MLKKRRTKKAYPQILDRLNFDDKIESKEESEARLEEAVREQYDCNCLGGVAVTFLTADCFLGPRTAENHSAYDHINFLLAEIRNLPGRRKSPQRIVEEFHLCRDINKAFDTLPHLCGWRLLSNEKCEKVYEIDGRYYICQAGRSSDASVWALELFWPDEFGLRPFSSGASLLIAAQRIEDQIEILRLEGHGRVDCEGLGI